MRECLDEGILQSYFDGELFGEQMESATLHLASCSNCARAARELQSELGIMQTAMAAEFDDAVPTESLRRRIDAAVAGLEYENRRVAETTGSSPRGWWQALAALFALTPQRAFGYAGLAAVVAFAAIFGIIQLRQGPVKVMPAEVAVGPAIKTAAPLDTPARALVTVPAPVAVATPLRDNSVRRQPRRSVATSDDVAQKTLANHVKLLPGERSYLKTIAALDTTIQSKANRPMRPALRAEYERNLALVDRALAATRNAAKKNPNDPDAAEFMFTAYQNKVNLLNTVADARSFNRHD